MRSLALSLPFLVLLLFVPALEAGTIHVPADQPTIQAGIDAAANGDTVLVAIWFTASGWPGSMMLRQFRDLPVPADTLITTTLSFPIPSQCAPGQYDIHGKVGYIDEWIADAENAIVQIVR